jgi:hypothetical protein
MNANKVPDKKYHDTNPGNEGGAFCSIEERKFISPVNDEHAYNRKYDSGEV